MQIEGNKVNVKDKELAKINTELADIAKDFPDYVKDIVEYSLLSGGKRLRPLLTVCTANLFGYDRKDIYKLASCIELTHAASLLHDDILDKAQTRHKKSASYLKFGEKATILAGDIMLAKASQIINTFDNIKLCDALARAVYHTSYGEILELHYQNSSEHNIDKYVEIISGKTGYLIQTACELGGIIAKATPYYLENICSYGLNLGLAFQIIDDALDFYDESIIGKSRGGDLKEGKWTPPIQYYCQSLEKNEQKLFLEKFKNSNFTDSEVNLISERILALKIDEKTRDYADTFIQKAKLDLTHLPQNKATDILKDVLKSVKLRNK